MRALVGLASLFLSPAHAEMFAWLQVEYDDQLSATKPGSAASQGSYPPGLDVSLAGLPELPLEECDRVEGTGADFYARSGHRLGVGEPRSGSAPAIGDRNDARAAGRLLSVLGVAALGLGLQAAAAPDRVPDRALDVARLIQMPERRHLQGDHELPDVRVPGRHLPDVDTEIDALELARPDHIIVDARAHRSCPSLLATRHPAGGRSPRWSDRSLSARRRAHQAMPRSQRAPRPVLQVAFGRHRGCHSPPAIDQRFIR
jgi:hypothetical protein